MVQLTSSIKENPRLRAAAEELKKAGVKVGDAVSEALKTMEESEIMRAVRVSHSSIIPGGTSLTDVLHRSPRPPVQSVRPLQVRPSLYVTLLPTKRCRTR